MSKLAHSCDETMRAIEVQARIREATEKEPSTCQFCDGFGYVPNSLGEIEDCPECDGRGVVA